jgi:DNA gyrase subunit B
MNAWCERLQTLLDSSEAKVSVTLDIEHQTWCPLVDLKMRGISEQIQLTHSFFVGAEYRAIAAMSRRLAGFIEPGAAIQRGEKSLPITRFGEAYAWLLSEARRGVDMQRYKGLGEMNPDQLWSTTMDPEVRRMLQVSVDDVIAADRMFTTLMGDQVEPRREFIEANALTVVNLDV